MVFNGLEYHIENDSTLVISLQLLLLFQKIFSCIFCYGTYTWPHGVMNKVSNFGSGVVTVFFQRATLKQRGKNTKNWRCCRIWKLGRAHGITLSLQQSNLNFNDTFSWINPFGNVFHCSNRFPDVFATSNHAKVILHGCLATCVSIANTPWLASQLGDNMGTIMTIFERISLLIQL